MSFRCEDTSLLELEVNPTIKSSIHVKVSRKWNEYSDFDGFFVGVNLIFMDKYVSLLHLYNIICTIFDSPKSVQFKHTNFFF